MGLGLFHIRVAICLLVLGKSYAIPLFSSVPFELPTYSGADVFLVLVLDGKYLTIILLFLFQYMVNNSRYRYRVKFNLTMMLNHSGNVILNDSRTSISVLERLHWFPRNMNPFRELFVCYQ